MSDDGWFPDPTRGHELRYFDGVTWTDHVCDNGRSSVHPWSPAPAANSASWYEPTTIGPAADNSTYGRSGYPAQQFTGPGYAGPGYGGPGYSQPGGWQPVPPKGNKRLGVIAAVVAVVVLALASLGVYAAVNDPVRNDPAAAEGSTPPTNPAATPSATPEEPLSSTPPETPPADNTGKPVLKDSARPVRVIGTTYAAGEPTYTMAFAGWPFAFRVPSTFGCIRGTTTLPGAKSWVCVNEKDASAKHRISVMFRPCPTTCTSSEQQSMRATWFEAPGRTPSRFDATTSYIEDSSNDRGLYGLDMSHFFGPRSGGPLRWQVGMYVESPTATKATMHKVINEVRSQTP